MSELTQDEKCALIAESLGWTQTTEYKFHDGSGGGPGSRLEWKPPSAKGKIIGTHDWIAGLTPPKYFNDLNVCYEMEKSVGDDNDERYWYVDALKDSTGASNEDDYEGLTPLGNMLIVNASASQRAEAFGKFRKLW